MHWSSRHAYGKSQNHDLDPVKSRPLGTQHLVKVTWSKEIKPVSPPPGEKVAWDREVIQIAGCISLHQKGGPDAARLLFLLLEKLRIAVSFSV